MIDNQNLKRAVEKSAGDRFIKLHNSEFSCNFQFESAPTFDPPDLIYCDGTNGQKLLIESTAVYYSKEDAKFLWKFKREDTEPAPEEPSISVGPLITEPTDSFQDKVLQLVEKHCTALAKAKKSRPNDFLNPIILIVDLNHLLFTNKKNVQDFIENYPLTLSEDSYQEVWILGNESVRSPLFSGESVIDIPLVEAPATTDFRLKLFPNT